MLRAKSNTNPAREWPSLQEWLSSSDRDGRAGHVAGKRIGQHHTGTSQFGRLGRAFHRNLFAEILHGVLGQGRRDEWRPDRPRGDSISANPLLASICAKPTGPGGWNDGRKTLDRAAPVG